MTLSYKRAVSPSDKKKIITRLLKLWDKYPDWRLGQLLSNFYPKTEIDLFFIEDFDFINILEKKGEE